MSHNPVPCTQSSALIAMATLGQAGNTIISHDFDIHLCIVYTSGACGWVQAAIPTTAVPTKSEQWRQNEINIAGAR